MKQDKKFITAREKAKKYIPFSKLLGGFKSGTYAKISGGKYNGVQNGELNPTDIERLKTASIEAKKEIQDIAKNGMKAINKFDEEIKRIESL